MRSLAFAILNGHIIVISGSHGIPLISHTGHRRVNVKPAANINP